MYIRRKKLLRNWLFLVLRSGKEYPLMANMIRVILIKYFVRSRHYFCEVIGIYYLGAFTYYVIT